MKAVISIFLEIHNEHPDAAEVSLDAIVELEGTITPFPEGIVASGSKSGANKYKFLKATTN